jgi:hypothetical protein
MMSQQFAVARHVGTLVGQPGHLDAITKPNVHDINWNALLGFGIATVVSVGIWIGIGTGIAYVLR